MKIANINMQEGAGESCCKSNRQFSYFRLPLRIQMYATFFFHTVCHIGTCFVLYSKPELEFFQF